MYKCKAPYHFENSLFWWLVLCLILIHVMFGFEEFAFLFTVWNWDWIPSLILGTLSIAFFSWDLCPIYGTCDGWNWEWVMAGTEKEKTQMAASTELSAYLVRRVSSFKNEKYECICAWEEGKPGYSMKQRVFLKYHIHRQAPWLYVFQPHHLKCKATSCSSKSLCHQFGVRNI